MKKLILLILISFSITISAQKEFYTSVAVSATNSTNFNNTTQYSLELGMLNNNVTYSVIAGSTDLKYKQFWYQVRIGYEFNYISDNITPYLITGVGSYFHNDTMFIEYGGGIKSNFEGISPFLQISNRDKINYLSLGLKINL